MLCISYPAVLLLVVSQLMAAFVPSVTVLEKPWLDMVVMEVWEDKVVPVVLLELGVLEMN